MNEKRPLTEVPSAAGWWRLRGFLQHDRFFLAGLVLVAGLLVMALLADVLAPGDPAALGATADRLQPPQAAHPLGTDLLGRDVLVRLVHGGRVSLALEVDGEQVWVSVRDSGPGVATADLPHIFEPFYRSANARSAKGHAGLGLAIARRIVDLQDGEIAALNCSSGGAAFAFTLPLQAP